MNIEPEHGKIYRVKATGRRIRWCSAHKDFHGVLYDCEHLPEHVRRSIFWHDFKMKAILVVWAAVLFGMMLRG